VSGMSDGEKNEKIDAIDCTSKSSLHQRKNLKKSPFFAAQSLVQSASIICCKKNTRENHRETTAIFLREKKNTK